MLERPTEVVVIGLGNRHRGDDGVGLEVARRLRGQVPPNVRVIEAGGDGFALMDAWKEAATTYVVDAATCDDPPGTVHRFESEVNCIQRDLLRCSSHAFGLLETLDLARALGHEPSSLVIYAVVGRRFRAGEDLSSEVASAVTQVAQRVLHEIVTRSSH